MRKTNDYLFKIILVGDSGVGKTNIMCRFAPGDMNIIGVDFKIRTIELDGQIVKLQIWDTAGQERFKTITTAYYRGAMGIMLVYDICNANSFDSISGYHKHLKENSSRGVEIMLLGNNCHMKVKRQVNKETGERFAAEHGMKFMEVSADESVNIEEAFFTLARQILHKIEAATSSDECVQEDGSDEFRPGACMCCAMTTLYGGHNILIHCFYI